MCTHEEVHACVYRRYLKKSAISNPPGARIIGSSGSTQNTYYVPKSTVFLTIKQSLNS